MLAVVACDAGEEEPGEAVDSEPGGESEPAGPPDDDGDSDGRGQAGESEEDGQEARGGGPGRPEPAEEQAAPHGGAYGVSAGHPDAVDAGMQVLAEGGTAVDAAVATAFAVSVAEPFASGLGGGGAAVVHEPGGEPLSYDYRDPVPVSGDVPASYTGTPGFVAGMEELHAEHGTGDFARLVEPAIALAEDGTETSESLAYWLRSGGIPVGQLPHMYPDGAALGEGDPLVQEELAATLRQLADEGPRSFYEGALADELASAAGAVDAESLEAYEVAVHEPTVGRFAGYEVVSSAPPLAGAALIQLLQIAEALGAGDHEPGSADYHHALAVAWRIAEQHLNWEIADPAFVDVPTGELTDADRNAAIAEQVGMASAPSINPSQPRGGIDAPDYDAAADADDDGSADDEAEDGNTTHITVVDGDGAMVVMTNTISNFWGSGDYALGFFLNDQLSNFGARTGSPNAPAEAGKRIVGSSAPAILLDDDGLPVLGLGSPGGRRIPSILGEVLIRWGLHGQTLQEAIDAPRQHAEGSTVMFEEWPPGGVTDDLAGRGHGGFDSPTFAYYFGSVQALEVDYDADEVSGAVDPRRDGDWRAEQP